MMAICDCICIRGCNVVRPRRGLGGLSLWLAWVFAVEGAVWCSLGVGWDSWGCNRRGCLPPRVQCGVPSARAGAAMRSVDARICCRGCGIMLPGRGLGGLRLRLACVSASEGAGVCSLGEGWRGGDGSLRPHLLPRVQCGAPWARAGVAMRSVDVCICAEGAGVRSLGVG